MILACGLLCTGLGSCREEELVQPQEQTYEQGFTGTTRVDGITGEPEHADTYRIMAYVKDGSSKQIPNSYQYGSYAYDLAGDYSNTIGTVGTLVPVAVSTSSPYNTTLSSGKLVRNGVNGLHLTTGDYYVSMIYPCVRALYASGLGYLAVFNRTEKVYASQPLDKAGTGDVNTAVPFEIKVTKNDELFDVTGVVMHPLMSAIKVYLYSHFYKEGATSSSVINFTVEEIKLVNAGVNGWYNPMQEIIYPNYNYVTSTTYSKDLVLASGSTANAEALSAQLSGSDAFVKDGETITPYVTGNEPVFPSDYRGSDMGGSPYVIPMTLQLKLEADGLFNKASIPISIVIERNKVYKFYVNVTSEQIGITYSVNDWVSNDWGSSTDGADYTDLGGTLDAVSINWSGDWTTGVGGDDQVIQ